MSEDVSASGTPLSREDGEWFPRGGGQDAQGLLQGFAPGALPLRMLLDPDPYCRATHLQPGFMRPGQGLAFVSLLVESADGFWACPAPVPPALPPWSSFVAWAFPGFPTAASVTLPISPATGCAPCRTAPSAEVVVHVAPAGSGTPPGAAAACTGLCPPPPRAAQEGLLCLERGRPRAQNRVSGHLCLRNPSRLGAALTVVADC